jgi:hypothetical protein
MARASIVVIALVAACGGPPSAVSPRAGGAFPDNPQLVHVPADTPYAFVTFDAPPIDALRKFAEAFRPAWDRARAANPMPGETERMWRELLDTIGPLDAAHLDKIGLSLTAHLAIYGLGPYPVARFELASGDRLLAFARMLAGRWGVPLAAPVERNGRRYWILESKPDVAFLIAIAPSELVVAAAPRAVLDRQLALILGDELPREPLATARFRELAKRDGFSGVGVGFVDLARVAALATASASPGCQQAAADFVRRVPRVAFGYDEMSTRRLSFGIVVELAPDVLAAARTVSTSLTGIDRLMRSRAVFAFALAADLDKVKAFAPRVATAIRGLDECGGGYDRLAKPLDDLAQLQIPSYLAGIHGVLAAMTGLAPGTSPMERIEGYAVVQVANAETILKQLGTNLPGFDPPEADGKAKPIPFLGHIAARPDTIAVAHGAHSEAAAEEALTEPPAPAPLAVLRWDYGRLPEMEELFPTGHSDLDVLQGLSQTLGMATFQVDVDDRGLVSWFAMELR